MHPQVSKPCMRLPALLAAYILVIPTYTTAQTTAADGVQALIRDDYATAIRILRPLVEGRADPDPVAAFFLALAYQSGGRRSDPIRVCGLLMKAAVPGSPLMAQAEALARQFHMNSTFARNLCSVASIRGWGEPAPTAFTLAPDHRVRVDQSGIAIDYRGSQQVTERTWGGAGWTFLPTRLTEIETAAPGASRRYFLEWFAWVPTTPDEQPLWVLSWFASEIVGTEIVAVPGDGGVARFIGAQPPESFAVGDLARFVVVDNAQVDRVVIGEQARSVRIPSRSVQ